MIGEHLPHHAARATPSWRTRRQRRLQSRHRCAEQRASSLLEILKLRRHAPLSHSIGSAMPSLDVEPAHADPTPEHGPESLAYGPRESRGELGQNKRRTSLRTCDAPARRPLRASAQSSSRSAPDDKRSRAIRSVSPDERRWPRAEALVRQAPIRSRTRSTAPTTAAVWMQPRGWPTSRCCCTPIAAVRA